MPDNDEKCVFCGEKLPAQGYGMVCPTCEVKFQKDFEIVSWQRAAVHLAANDISIIPANIKRKIPEDFYIALCGELFSLCGQPAFEEWHGTYGLSYISPALLYHSLRATCKKLSLKWFMKFYDKLNAEKSNLVNKELTNNTIKTYESRISCGKNLESYYHRLAKL